MDKATLEGMVRDGEPDPEAHERESRTGRAGPGGRYHAAMPRQPEWRSPRGRRAAQRSRTYRRNVATLIVVAALLTPLAVASLWVLSNVESSTAGNADIVVEVVQGWTPAQVGDTRSSRRGSSTRPPRSRPSRPAPGTGATSPGTTTSSPTAPHAEALDTLRGGPRRSLPDLELLLPPGLTLGQIAERVGKLEGKSAAAFLAAAASGTVRSRYEPPQVNSLEGLTWPDTYRIGVNETETEILQKIVNQFDTEADALAAGGSYPAVIIASLIEAEAGSKEDAPSSPPSSATG